MQIQRAALIHARVDLLHLVDAKHLTVDSHSACSEGYLGAVAVPRVNDIGAHVAGGFAVPLEIGAGVDHLVLDGHREKRLDLDLEQNGAVVRVAVVLHVALVEAGVFALQIRHQDNTIEVHLNRLGLQTVTHAIHNSIPFVVRYRVALGDALERGVGADSWQLSIGKHLRELGPDARVTLRALRAHYAQIGGLARLRRNIAQVLVASHDRADVVARVTAGHTRKVEVSVAGNESLARLLHLLREHVEEPDVVDVFGVFVVVEAVDDGLAETARDHCRTLAFLEAIEDDFAQLHDIRVDGAELIGGFAVVGARVFAARAVDDQVAAVLEIARVEEIDRVEFVLGAQA